MRNKKVMTLILTLVMAMAIPMSISADHIIDSEQYYYFCCDYAHVEIYSDYIGIVPFTLCPACRHTMSSSAEATGNAASGTMRCGGCGRNPALFSSREYVTIWTCCSWTNRGSTFWRTQTDCCGWLN